MHLLKALSAIRPGKTGVTFRKRPYSTEGESRYVAIHKISFTRDMAVFGCYGRIIVGWVGRLRILFGCDRNAIQSGWANI